MHVLAKQRDDEIGSVPPSVCVFADALISGASLLDFLS